MHAAFGSLYSSFGIPDAAAPLFFALLGAVMLWTIILKGFALWYSARAGQKWWFIALLALNTLGILEIIYLIWFRPQSEALATAPMGSSAAQ